jgi:hypothetical protein
VIRAARVADAGGGGGVCLDECEGKGIEATTHNPPFLLLSPFFLPLLFFNINLTLKNDSSLLDTPVRERFNVGIVAH